MFFRYDRSLLDILFKAAASAVQTVHGSDTQSPALVLTAQTAGEALNFNPHLHGLLAHYTSMRRPRFLAAIDTERITEHFRHGVLAELITRGLITDEVPAQILSQEHSGFGAWVGDSFTEEDRTRFVARYIERGPLSLENSLSPMISSHTPPMTGQHTSSTPWNFWRSCRARFRSLTSL